jgi:RNA polymerase sigma factor (sigma-70 family)
VASNFEEADPGSGPPDVVYASFGELYACTRAAMVKLASFLVVSRAEGEELTQDAYAELYRQWDTVRNPAALLRTLVVRRCSRARERRFNERRVLSIVGHADDPYVGVEAEVDGTLAAVRRLKPERRDVVVLRFYADLSHAQIAEALDCSVVTVRTRLHRALADLRQELS